MQKVIKYAFIRLILVFGVAMPCIAKAQLFELSSEGKTLGYLFGSTHGALQGLSIQFQRLEFALSQSKFVVMETAEGLSKELQEEFLGLGGQSTVLDVAPSDNKACIMSANDEMMKDIRWQTSLRVDFKSVPFLFTNRYFGHTVNSYLPAKGPGYDGVIFEYARRKSIPLASLESAQEKIKIIGGFRFDDSYSIMATLCKLRDSASDREEFLKLQLKVIDHYNGDDADGVAKTTVEIYQFLGASNDFIEKFYGHRNKQMAGKIEKMARNGYRPFFAIGAAHLGGSDGIVKLLNANGVNTKLVPVSSTH